MWPGLFFDMGERENVLRVTYCVAGGIGGSARGALAAGMNGLVDGLPKPDADGFPKQGRLLSQQACWINGAAMRRVTLSRLKSP